MWPLLLALFAAAPQGGEEAGAAADGVLRFGVISDVHQDLIPDAAERVASFVTAATDFGADFVVQLGDFCTPVPANRAFLAAYETFDGPRLHVLGNHETDGGHGWPAVRSFLGLADGERVHAAGGVRFLLLDGNVPNPAGGPPGYARHLGAEQRAWLARELAADGPPLVLLSHQGPAPDLGLDDGDEVRALLRQAPPGRVLAWLHGHDHTDRVRWLDGIPVVSVNSASYFWVGAAHAHGTYGEAIEAEHPVLARTCPYREPLFLLVELDLARGELRLTGRESDWVGPSPFALPGWSPPAGHLGIRPAIRTRTLALPQVGAKRYESVEVRGWWAQLEAALADDAPLRDEVLALLDAKLREVSGRLPAPVVRRLQEVPLWLHLASEATPGGVYHPSAGWLREHGFDPRWAGGIELGNARNFLTWVRDQPSMVLHELAHAWHHQVLGYDHAPLRAAFERARDAGTYAEVLYVRGGKKRAYALENPMEFFAEASEAWWGTNDFYPFVRGELLEHDPQAARAVAAAWEPARLEPAR